jgi:hypothetical protein
MDAAKERNCGNTRSSQLEFVRQPEKVACQLAKDVKTLIH